MTAEKIKAFFSNKTVRIVLVCLLALLLLFVCYRVFAGGKDGTEAVGTAQEERLADLLQRIDGVEKATVMITEENGEAVGAIIFFDGTDGLVVRMRILEVTSAALGISRSDVLVYPSA